MTQLTTASRHLNLSPGLTGLALADVLSAIPSNGIVSLEEQERLRREEKLARLAQQQAEQQAAAAMAAQLPTIPITGQWPEIDPHTTPPLAQMIDPARQAAEKLQGAAQTIRTSLPENMTGIERAAAYPAHVIAQGLDTGAMVLQPTQTMKALATVARQIAAQPVETAEAIGEQAVEFVQLPDWPMRAMEALTPADIMGIAAIPKLPLTVKKLTDKAASKAAKAKALQQAVLNAEGTEFETGKPVSFAYMRNTVPAPDMGAKFGQDIEPAGRYISHRTTTDDLPPEHRLATGEVVTAWEAGEVTFENPLVIEHGSTKEWKARLSKAYDGKTGQELSAALRADGHDGIVTVWPEKGFASEIVDLQVPDFADEILAVGGSIDKGGSVKLFHRTTPEAAAEIRRTGQMTGKEDGIFFSTSPEGQTTGYGSEVVEVNIPLSDLQLDDLFKTEAHLRLPLNRAGEKVAVDVVDATPIRAGTTTKSAVEEFGEQMVQKHRLSDFEIHEIKNPETGIDDIQLSMITVPKESRKQGIGSAAIQDLINFADEHGKRITLTTNIKSPEWGTTSSARLKKFYKQFGFVENKGRNKDFRIRDNMYRDPR